MDRTTEFIYLLLNPNVETYSSIIHGHWCGAMGPFWGMYAEGGLLPRESCLLSVAVPLPVGLTATNNKT